MNKVILNLFYAKVLVLNLIFGSFYPCGAMNLKHQSDDKRGTLAEKLSKRIGHLIALKNKIADVMVLQAKHCSKAGMSCSEIREHMNVVSERIGKQVMRKCRKIPTAYLFQLNEITRKAWKECFEDVVIRNSDDIMRSYRRFRNRTYRNHKIFLEGLALSSELKDELELPEQFSLLRVYIGD